MKATLKSLTFVILSVLATGCASLSLEGDGNSAGHPDSVIAQMEDNSRGK